MSAALEHAQWTELIGVNQYDHIVGSGIVVLFLILVSFKVRAKCTGDSSLVPSSKFSLSNLLANSYKLIAFLDCGLNFGNKCRGYHCLCYKIF